MAETQQEVPEALYTLHVVTKFEVNTEIAGLRRLGGEKIGDKLFASEWLITADHLDEATGQFNQFEIAIKQFRVYKPDKDIFCVVDWELLQSAIDNGYTIQV